MSGNGIMTLRAMPAGGGGAGGAPGGAAGGDLSGTYPNPSVAAAAITLAKMANLAANSFIANNTGGAATPIAMTVAQAKTLLAYAFSDLSGSVAAAQMPALTGDVTTSAGAVATTIGAGKVTLAMQVNAAANSFRGNNTGGAATPMDMTVAQAKTLLAISLTADVTGTLQAAQFPTLTGDVTTAGGALATTIAAAAVTLAKMANLAANSIIGNNTGGAATPLALTMAQVMAALSASSGADFSMNTHKITAVVDPTSAQDAATKNYVDAVTKTLTNTRVTKRSVALTDAATVAINSDNGDQFTLLATSGVGNTRALGNPSGTPTSGQTMLIRYKQDGTGSRALTVTGANYTIPTDLGGGTTVPTSTAASATDWITFIWDDVASKWVLVGIIRGS